MKNHYLTFYRVPLLLLLGVCLPVHAANISIINSDGEDEGLNDTSPFTPAGGNHATTLGQARLNALQYAANIASQYIVSSVVIVIDAQFNNLGGDGSSATLGSAGPVSVVSDFGAGTDNTWYPVALAEALKGTNINSSYDIVARFNTDIDNQTVLGDTDWYYGLDGNAGTDNDFVTAALHEILHGLGFLTVMSDTGVLESGQVDVFVNKLEHHGATPDDYPGMTNAQRLTGNTATGNLHWIGTNVIANSGPLTGGKTGNHAHMFAPSTLESGSSISHFSTSVTPDEIMEPYYVDANHDIGLSVYLLQDIGWTVKTGTGSADLHLALDNSGAGKNVTYTLTVTNNGSDAAVEATVTYMFPEKNSYESSSPEQGSCSYANQIVSCQLGDLNPASSTTVTVIVKSNSSYPTHAAIVSSATSEANNADNRVSHSVAITGRDKCFIATAAYGSLLNKEVVWLRKFRDQYLLPNNAGKKLVDLYYQISPPVADRIRNSEVIRALMRGSLGPAVALSRWITKNNSEQAACTDTSTTGPNP